MKITAQDLQRHYASLADEELLLLNRDDLTDLARPCYETELERRGLNAAEPPKEAEPVAVATFANVNSAALARSVLKAAGIPCYLEN